MAARLIASCGVTTPADLAACRTAGMAGAIVGKAIYEGTITEQQLQRLILTAEKEPYEKERLGVLRKTTAGHRFNVSQVGRLLTLLTYEHAKLALLELVAPRIIDAHQGHRLSTHFAYTASKAKLRKMFPAGRD